MKHWKNWKNWIALGFVLTATFSNVACSKKSSDNSNNGAVYNPAPGVGGVLNGTCQNCNFSQASLFNITTQSSNMQINWQVLGDQNIISQIAAYGGNPQKVYPVVSNMNYGYNSNATGPAAVVGSAVLNQDLFVGNCVIPVGQYQISTTQVGTATTGPIFNIPQILMTNTQSGVQIIAQVYNAVPIFDGMTNQIRNFFGYLVFQQAPIYQYSYYGQQGGSTGAVGNCGNAYTSFGNSY